MTLTIRKVIVLAIVAGVFLLANALVIAHWLNQAGVIDAAVSIRREFLTGTAITVIVALLILLTGPGRKVVGLGCRCTVCGHRQLGGDYCSDCGSRRRNS